MRFAFHEYFSISFKKYSPLTWVNYRRSSQEDIGKESRLLLGADLSYHRESLSLQGEYIHMQRDGIAELELNGWYVQGGYFLKNRHIEPAFRFDLIDKNDDKDDDQTKIFTGGINWYIEGHALKVQANIFHHIFAANAREVSGESSKTGVQIQNQIYF
jgi:phosphate-selective porin